MLMLKSNGKTGTILIEQKGVQKTKVKKSAQEKKTTLY